MTADPTPTYTDRHLRGVSKITGVNDVKFTDGMSGYAPNEIIDALLAGRDVAVEVKGFNRIVGWTIDEEYLFRKSDQDLEREHDELVKRYEREREETLTVNRARWAAREATLPAWLRERLTSLRERSDSPDSFDRDGWGYELVVCELARLYDLSPDLSETSDITIYDEQHGCSGNQHGVAKTLVRMHREGQSLANTVGALAPLTGKAAY